MLTLKTLKTLTSRSKVTQQHDMKLVFFKTRKSFYNKRLCVVVQSVAYCCVIMLPVNIIIISSSVYSVLKINYISYMLITYIKLNLL